MPFPENRRRGAAGRAWRNLKLEGFFQDMLANRLRMVPTERAWLSYEDGRFRLKPALHGATKVTLSSTAGDRP